MSRWQQCAITPPPPVPGAPVIIWHPTCNYWGTAHSFAPVIFRNKIGSDLTSDWYRGWLWFCNCWVRVLLRPRLFIYYSATKAQHISSSLNFSSLENKWIGWNNVGPVSQTVDQHFTNIGSNVMFYLDILSFWWLTLTLQLLGSSLAVAEVISSFFCRKSPTYFEFN